MGMLGGWLLHLVLPSIATVIAGYLTKILHTQAKKAGLDLTQAQDDAIKAKVLDIVVGIEERAAGGDVKKDGKHDEAVTKIESAFPQLSEVQIEDAIKQAVPKMRGLPFHFGPH